MAFKPGASGNPAGRPKGGKDKRSRLKDMLSPHSEELLAKAVSMALDGNEQMLRLLLDRLLPAKPKDNPVDISLPDSNLMEQIKNITTAINEQKISPSTALTLIKYTQHQIGISEFSELLSKINQLEEKLEYGQELARCGLSDL